MFNDLRNRLEDKFFTTIIANLSEEKISEFRQVTETEDQEKVSQFITTNLPNASELFAGAMMSFRDVYLGVAN